MYNGQGASTRGPVANLAPPCNNTAAAISPSSEAEQALYENGSLTSECFDAVMELRRRLTGVLTPMPHADEATNGRPPAPPRAPIVLMIEDLNAGQRRILELLRATLNELAV